MQPFDADLLWMVVAAFCVAFVLALAVGANDVANAFGTSVGSGVLTFRQACLLATVFEVSGSILLGYKVADTMRKGILDVAVFEGRETLLVCGMLSALVGSTAWIFIATFLRLPVSTTHSIVGSTVGFSVVANGLQGLNTATLGQIMASWFVSPLLSGLIGLLIFTVIQILVINAKSPLKAALFALPIIYGLTIFVNVLGIILDGSKLLHLDSTPAWAALAISAAAMLTVAIFVQIFVVPRQKQRLLAPTAQSQPATGVYQDTTTTTRKTSMHAVDRLFHFLQILSAVFTSFSHGGNDVSNSIGPLIAVWTIYREGSALQKAESPVYLLFYGGIGMVVGLWLLGRRVNDTIGRRITKITPPLGFTIETSAATTVLLASKLGIPVSSTHCIVGSVVALGCVYGEQGENNKKVDWSLFRSIIYAWLITLPVAGGISAACMAVFMAVYEF